MQNQAIRIKSEEDSRVTVSPYLDWLRFLEKKSQKFQRLVEIYNSAIERGEHSPIFNDPPEDDPGWTPEIEEEISIHIEFERSRLEEKGITFEEFKEMDLKELLITTERIHKKRRKDYRIRTPQRLLEEAFGSDITFRKDSVSFAKKGIISWKDLESIPVADVVFFFERDQGPPWIKLESDFNETTTLDNLAKPVRQPHDERRYSDLTYEDGVHTQVDTTIPDDAFSGGFAGKKGKVSPRDTHDYRAVDIMKKWGLTDLQCQCLFFSKCWWMPHGAIANLLGIQRTVVLRHIRRAKNKILKYYEKNPNSCFQLA